MTNTHQGSNPLLFEQFYGLTEFAALVGVHKSTIVRWVQGGKLRPAHKNPGRVGPYLFHADDVARAKRHIQRRRRKAAA